MHGKLETLQNCHFYISFPCWCSKFIDLLPRQRPSKKSDNYSFRNYHGVIFDVHLSRLISHQMCLRNSFVVVAFNVGRFSER